MEKPQSLTINGALTINNNRQLNNNIVSGKELVLAGQINLSNDDTGRTLTIRSGATSTDAGIGKTVISGDIVNGGTGNGALILTSGWRESKPFYLSGTNTYSGLSDFQNGLVTIQGKQALSPGTTASISLGDVSMLAGNAQKGIPFLQLEGSAPGNVITGDITEAPDALTTGRPLSLNKTGSSVWTLEGDNSYTGATAISGGALMVNGLLDPASAVSVTGTATLGGSGSIGGSVTVAATANLAPGAPVGTLSVGGSLDISAPAGGAGKLNFQLGPIAASDRIAVTESAGGLVLTFQMLEAAARGTAVLELEHSNSLATGSWTTVPVPDAGSTVDDVVFTITGTGPLDVTATIPASKAASGKLFGRLKGQP